MIGSVEPRKPGAARMITGRLKREAMASIDKGWDVHSTDIVYTNEWRRAPSFEPDTYLRIRQERAREID